MHSRHMRREGEGEEGAEVPLAKREWHRERNW